MPVTDHWYWLDRSQRLYTLWARMVDRCRDRGWSELREKRTDALERAMADAERHVERSALAGFRAIADFRRRAGLVEQ